MILALNVTTYRGLARHRQNAFAFAAQSVSLGVGVEYNTNTAFGNALVFADERFDSEDAARLGAVAANISAVDSVSGEPWQVPLVGVESDGNPAEVDFATARAELASIFGGFIIRQAAPDSTPFADRTDLDEILIEHSAPRSAIRFFDAVPVTWTRIEE